MANDDKKNTSKAKAHADEMRKKFLKKYDDDYRSKKLDSKKTDCARQRKS